MEAMEAVRPKREKMYEMTMETMMRFINPLCLLLATVLLNGCVLTKLVSVPMRVAGAAVSIIPVAGNTVHDAIDGAADGVDDLPF
jgi:hypothetical protein